LYLVLFDVDGTLVDSQHAIVAAMTAAFEDFGLPVPPRQAILGVVGLSLVHAVSGLLEEPHAHPVEAIADRYKQAFHDLRRRPDHVEPLYAGARETLDALSARPDVLVGLATGKGRRGVAGLIDMHGLHGRFATIQTADDHPSKPDPSMILAALAETGVDRTRAVIVGDSSYDMAMARQASIAALGVGWGYQDTTTLERYGADAIVERYDLVIPAIARLLAWA
jgi:phosphoglycolate phosphatase